MDIRRVVIPISDSLDYEVFIRRKTGDQQLDPGKFTVSYRLYDVFLSGVATADEEAMAFAEVRYSRLRASHVVDFSSSTLRSNVCVVLSQMGLPQVAQQRTVDLILSEARSTMELVNEGRLSLVVYVASVSSNVLFYETGMEDIDEAYVPVPPGSPVGVAVPELVLATETDMEEVDEAYAPVPPEASMPQLVPATEASIQGLERVEAEASMDDCAICFEKLEVGSEATRMPCSHIYHGECIITWLRTSHVCPLCRFAMPH